ncbi:MAG: DUF5688 family protein [Lachnospiraceae bacterium]|nr:DUF5688 family protein [Lachnospiraceae bacterium]
MNYEEFKNKLVCDVSERLDSSINVTLKQITKNNGTKFDALLICEEGRNIAPTIYIQSFFEEYQKDLDMENTVNQILDIYRTSMPNANMNIDVFVSYEKCKDLIVYKVINQKDNEELLQSIPHYDFLDLSVVYEIMADKFLQSVTNTYKHENCEGYVLISSYMLNMWNITEEELREQAIKNTPLLRPHSFRNILEVLGIPAFEDTEDDKPKMYILTNKSGIHGASAMLYSNVLRDISDELQSNLFIIPSSIHEIIIISENENIDSDDMNSFISYVNSTNLEPEEILSDHMYYYNRSTNRIVM